MESQEQYRTRFPIGPFEQPKDIAAKQIQQWIKIIEQFPTQLKELVADLEEDKQAWQYRKEGWTIKEVVHHCADSHMNSLVRFKWTLTEKKPTIKAYFEDRWACLEDYNQLLTSSLDFLSLLHQRWCVLLKSLNDEQLNRSFIHPETDSEISLKENIGIYAWYCMHHLAHIKLALQKSGNLS